MHPFFYLLMLYAYLRFPEVFEDEGSLAGGEVVLLELNDGK